MFINPPIIFGVNLTPTSVNIYLFIFCFRFNDFSEFNGDNSVNIKLTCWYFFNVQYTFCSISVPWGHFDQALLVV